MVEARKHVPTSTSQNDKPKRKRTPAEQCAEVERVAREHGADLSEEGFNEALKNIAVNRSRE